MINLSSKKKSSDVVKLKHRDSVMLAKKDLDETVGLSEESGSLEKINNVTKKLSKTSLSFSKQSTTDRVKEYVPEPIKQKLGLSDIFDASTGLPCLECIKLHLLGEGRLTESAALWIINEGANILKKEKNLIKVDQPVTICGDIHGQFYDLMTIFKTGGSFEDTNYLFLGDYVDRGYFSIECVLYMWALKICHPYTIFFLRGNHECRHITNYFTFKNECKIKYSIKIYNACMEAFDCLPLAAIVNHKLFCVHGGLSPELYTLEDINNINRFRELPSSGLFCDILWSDPNKNYGFEEHDYDYQHNAARGCSFTFSYKACCDFLKKNNLLGVIRAHQAQDDGFQLYRSYKAGFPSLITIFSAPNYCDIKNNNGAILRYENGLLHIFPFRCKPHPYWLPNLKDVFNWTLPYVGEQATNVVRCLLNVCSDDELNSEESTEETDSLITRKRKHIDFVFCLVKKQVPYILSLGNFRKGSEAVLKLEGLTSSGNLPYGELSGCNKTSLKTVLHRRKLNGNNCLYNNK